MNDTINPYRVPASVVADVGASADAEAVRQAHISTEASIRSMGLLYYFACAGCVFMAAVMLSDAASGMPIGMGMAAFVLALVAVFGAMGHGLRSLRPWVRIPAIVLSVVGLLGFPFGTLLNGYFLYLLLCAKGQHVFMPEYAAIIPLTPHVRNRSPLVVRVLVLLIIVGIVAVVLATAMSRGGGS